MGNVWDAYYAVSCKIFLSVSGFASGLDLLYMAYLRSQFSLSLSFSLYSSFSSDLSKYNCFHFSGYCSITLHAA